MNIFAKGQGAFIKVTSLAIGLTVGLVLIAKVQLEMNYDRCIADKEHVYELHETFFFDIFATKVLVGDARQILSTAGQCIISRRLSEKIGGDVVGKTFCFLSAPQKPMTISGVFDDYPENSAYSNFDILMSMPSVGTYSWDGTENLITTCIILGIVAFVMLFTAVMNYILVVISALVGRARQVALRKVLGAPRREFYLKTLKEAAVHLLSALLIMTLLLMAGQDWVHDLLGVSVTALFSAQTFTVLTAVCLIVLLCCGLLPGYIYSRIPVTYAYRLYSESKRTWKLSLLAFQFVLSTMLLCVLSTIYRQYNYMLNADMGYQYDRVAYVDVRALHGDSIYSLAREIENLPGIDDVVGRQFVNSAVGEEYPMTVIGIVKDFRLGSLVSREERPVMIANGNVWTHNEMADSYQETKRTRDQILIGCLASLLITLIGLIGYVRDEVQRRSRELAIRKVMGAGVGELQGLFLRSIALIAIPSIIVGVGLGWYFSTMLMEQFADKITLSWYVFAACALFVLLIIAAIVLLQTYRVATSNPVNYLKTE